MPTISVNEIYVANDRLDTAPSPSLAVAHSSLHSAHAHSAHHMGNHHSSSLSSAHGFALRTHAEERRPVLRPVSGVQQRLPLPSLSMRSSPAHSPLRSCDATTSAHGYAGAGTSSASSADLSAREQAHGLQHVAW
ncbi:hypothetical protein B0H13DRAFT_2325627 [Mycena leptocephala]|nr:hypothetical protein B0H13DRAFT_2325627 [Mycena leptocephala]